MTEDLSVYDETEADELVKNIGDKPTEDELMPDELPDIGTELGQNAADTVDRIVEVAAEKTKPEPTDIELLITAVRAVAEEVYELRMVLDMTNYHIGNLRPS